jgi:hypothetical protein
MNVILTRLQAMGIYPLARQALICTFLYHTSEYVALRTSCSILLMMKVWISMCTAPKTAFQLSPLIKVTCHSGWGDCNTLDIFKSCVQGHTGSAYNAGAEFPLCDTFLSGFKVFGKSLDLSCSVYIYFIHSEVVMKEHACIYFVCWWIALLRMFETFNFP